MSFFTRSNRTVKHLQSQLQDISEDIPWKMNIVVREWNEISPEYEFRGFVYNKKLTAITHYYKFCYVRDILEQKAKYLTIMQNYYEKISPLLPDNCVLDFCIFPKTETVCVVELNPWSVHASSAKFNWDEDMKILTGESEFEFRISEKPFPNIFDLVSSTLGIFWQIARPLRLEEGEQLPRDEERIIYSFKWNNYKTLPFYKITQGYTLKSNINWELILDQAVIVISRDKMERCFWENTSQFYKALDMKVNSFVNLEQRFPPQLITTFFLVIVMEVCVIQHKGKKLPQGVVDLAAHFQKGYLWLFDVFQVFNQPAAIKDKNSEISIYASNSCLTLTKWKVLEPKN